MIEIKQDFDNMGVYLSINSMGRSVKTGIRHGFNLIGKEFVEDSRDKMKNTERDMSRVYYVRVRGRVIRHNPSKPYFPAAIMTGELSKSVRYKVNGSDSMRFGAGYTKRVNYAKYVELGTKQMIERPYLKPAILENDRNAFTSFEKYINASVML
jgi:hypothetical protein